MRGGGLFRQQRIEAVALPRGLSTMLSWPWLSVGLIEPAPTNAAMPATPGTPRNASATALVRSSIAGNAMF
jgi:hypothetical protein